MKFILEGDTGKFGNHKIQDILCFCFATHPVSEGGGDGGEAQDVEDRPVIVTGGKDGSVLFWNQTSIDPGETLF